MKRHKYIITILALLLMVISVAGKPVTVAEVRDAVNSFLVSWDKQVAIEAIGARYLPGGEVGYYMVDLGQNGWVMVSGDDAVRPVLAFSFENTLTPESSWNDAALYMLDQYKGEISVAIKDPDLQRDMRWDRADLPSELKATAALPVLPFIDVKWNQGSGWNMFCPEDPDGPGGHAYVGCVAVAMAQAMSVYEYPSRPRGVKSYLHDLYGSIAVNYDMAAPYEWGEMSSTSYDSANAILLYHCAVSVSMDFGPDGSGAYVRTASSSMKQYFGYSQSLKFYDRLADNNEWVTLLVGELTAGRPIIYRGNPDDGTAGHAWNLDGYYASNDVNYFHMNFGWSGSQNGYYTLDNINPGSYEFNTAQGALVGISPPASMPYDLNLTEQTVMEGLTVGSWVADVEVADEDPENIYTFTCKGPFSILLDDYGPAAFYIEDGQLFTDQVFTYNETNPTANSKFLLIIVEDQYGHEYQEEFHIQIEKAYFGPSGIALSDSSVKENQPVGTAVGKLIVEDENPSNTYTFTLTGPWNPGMAGYDPASFYLENDSLKTAVVFDREEADTCYLLINLSDSYGNQLSRGFTIQIRPDQSGSTGIVTPTLVEDLLYPNPADQYVTFSNPGRHSRLEIYEASTGRKMLMLDTVAETIDVSGLPVGLYLVVVRSDEGLLVQKLLIQH
jgi:hypothetical protein